MARSDDRPGQECVIEMGSIVWVEVRGLYCDAPGCDRLLTAIDSEPPLVSSETDKDFIHWVHHHKWSIWIEDRQRRHYCPDHVPTTRQTASRRKIV
jgi:hypothetical protein